MADEAPVGPYLTGTVLAKTSPVSTINAEEIAIEWATFIEKGKHSPSVIVGVLWNTFKMLPTCAPTYTTCNPRQGSQACCSKHAMLALPCSYKNMVALTWLKASGSL